MDLKKQAYELLNNWKGSTYIHGLGVLDRVGEAVAALGRDALVIANTTRKSETAEKVLASLADAGITFGEVVPTAKPNSPKEDVVRLSKVITSRKPEVIITMAADLRSMPQNSERIGDTGRGYRTVPEPIWLPKSSTSGSFD